MKRAGDLPHHLAGRIAAPRQLTVTSRGRAAAPPYNLQATDARESYQTAQRRLEEALGLWWSGCTVAAPSETCVLKCVLAGANPERSEQGVRDDTNKHVLQSAWKRRNSNGGCAGAVNNTAASICAREERDGVPRSGDRIG